MQKRQLRQRHSTAFITSLTLLSDLRLVQHRLKTPRLDGLVHQAGSMTKPLITFSSRSELTMDFSSFIGPFIFLSWMLIYLFYIVVIS